MVGTSQNNILRQKYLENGLDLLNPIEFKPWTSLTSLGSDSIPGKLRRRSQWNHHVRKLKFWAPQDDPFIYFGNSWVGSEHIPNYILCFLGCVWILFPNIYFGFFLWIESDN